VIKKQDDKELDFLYVEGVGEVKKGMILEHPLFGVGKVEGVFEFASEEQNYIRLSFDKFGSKVLAPEFARLSLV